MADKKTALVLGGTVPHIELIHQLQTRGYYVILVDYLDDSPARPHADEHIQESTLDLDAVLKIAQERDAALVISSAIDQANITCCYVAEKLGLPHPYSYETALDVTHKDRMKRIMADNDIPTTPFIHSKNKTEVLESDLRLPLVVKPTNCNGSRGVRRIDDYDALGDAIDSAIEASRTDDYLVEEYATGTEVNYYCYVQDYVPHYIGSCYKTSYTDGVTGGVIQYSVTIYPANISQEAFDTLADASARIAKAFDLKNTPLFIQAKVDGSQVNILEFAPRLGGGLSYRNLQRITGMNQITLSLKSFLGEAVEGLDEMPHDQRISSISHLFAKEGVLDRLEGYEELVDDGTIEEFYVTKKHGAHISGDGSTGSRVASYIIEGETVDEIDRKNSIIKNRITVIGEDSRDLSLYGV